ncbi:immunity protein YezG family protein [Streptococcus oralis]|uniref:immunity protein YezG family protein n=1 Tax=Streptococcus oralis TaxID=1303 RepID=UPI0009B6ED72|nr:immunity protein YezG family protein [Streptococcus oralis]
MFENQLSQLFNDIANNVNRIIPVTWNDLYFNVELKEGEMNGNGKYSVHLDWKFCRSISIRPLFADTL